MTVEVPLARVGVSPFFVLLTASTGCAMTVLDTNIVAIILPTIARDFGASFAEVEWIVSTYVLCFASLLLPAGAIADRFGRRRVFLLGIAIFALASLLCGLAPSAAALYLARAFQGVGAAFLLAPALAIIGHSFHGEEERNRAWGIWGGIMGLTMVLAPIIGGLIAHALGWRWAFHANVPICAVLAFAASYMEESRDPNARRLDPAGIICFAATMFGLTSGLIYGQGHGWTSLPAVAGFATGLGSLLVFIVVESRQERPMLDLALFRNPRLVGGVWAMFAYAACTQVMASLLPLFLQNGLGRTPLEAGFAMLPFALTMLIFPHVGRLFGRRLGPVRILSIGLMIVAVGNALTGSGAALGNWPVIAVGMLVLGSGGGLLNGETQKAIMSVVPRERAGMASGISTTSRFSGILLGFAVLSAVLASSLRKLLLQADCLGAACRRSPEFIEAIVAGDLPHAVRGLTGPELEHAIAQARSAYSSGFSTTLITAAGIAAASAWAVAYLLGRRTEV